MSSSGPKKPSLDDVKKAVTDTAADFKEGFQESTQPKPKSESESKLEPPEPFRRGSSEKEREKHYDELLPRSTRNTNVDLSRPSKAKELGLKAGKVTAKSQRQLSRAERKIKKGVEKAVKEKNRRILDLKAEIATGKGKFDLKAAKGAGEKIGYGVQAAEDIKTKINDKKEKMKEDMKAKFDKSEVGRAFNEKLGQTSDAVDLASKTFTAGFNLISKVLKERQKTAKKTTVSDVVSDARREVNKQFKPK